MTEKNITIDEAYVDRMLADIVAQRRPFPLRPVTRRCYRFPPVAVLLLAGLAACGKKGPPLEPLRLTPAPVGEVAARRYAEEVELRFVLPTANSTGAERIDLDHIEVYAVTVAPGSVTPPNRDLLTKARIVGTIPVRPPLLEGEPEPPPTDKRPAPGERVRFVEKLTEAALTPCRCRRRRQRRRRSRRPPRPRRPHADGRAWLGADSGSAGVGRSWRAATDQRAGRDAAGAAGDRRSSGRRCRDACGGARRAAGTGCGRARRAAARDRAC